jgi:Tfp pilus assembly protein PilP
MRASLFLFSLSLACSAAVVTAAPAVVATPAPTAPTTKTPAATPAAAPVVPAADTGAFTYDPDRRRDPFVSLLRRGTDSDGSLGSRPAGLMGLSSAEVTLKGILASRGGYVAIVRGADNRTYIVHSGDKLLDGAVRTIAADAMVILQQVNDPLSHQKEREVRKVLRQTEEAR